MKPRNSCDGIEERVERETGTKLPEPGQSITIRQRKTIGFVTIARTMFRVYPRRTILGLSLFIGQAFLYNAITFGYAQILATFFQRQDQSRLLLRRDRRRQSLRRADSRPAVRHDRPQG